jgi:hypothetical protein
MYHQIKALLVVITRFQLNAQYVDKLFRKEIHNKKKIYKN